MKAKCFCFVFVFSMTLVSCDTFLQAMGGYGMSGYQVMPGGFVRNTSMDYLLDPRYAMQQVLNQEQQEYQAAKRYRPDLTLEQFRLEKGQAYQMMKNSGGSSSSSSSTSSSSYSYSNNSSGRDCGLCHGSGKCNTCNGKGWYYGELSMTTKLTCPNCPNHNGRCSSCNGTGRQ
ncbi:MAG: hypothetical protein IJK87_07155 [Prevotella sp.]|nr:hypothetical protein [Prevotella sp.]